MTVYKPPNPPGEFTLPLTVERLNWQLDVLGWDRDELALRLDLRGAKIANWIKGRSFVPNTVAIWLEMLARVLAANPRPLEWEERDPDLSASKHGHDVFDEDEDEEEEVE